MPMMSGQITISIWLFLLLLVITAWAVLDRILIPSTRWFLRRRINRVIDEISTRLDIQIKPFQITKRQVLIDRLVYDPKVIEAVQHEASERDCPREILKTEVVAYAKEVVPSFNAYLYFRLGYWLAKKIAHLLYRVRIDFSRMERSARFLEIEKFADQLMSAIKKVVPILPISLVATVMKEIGSQGVSAIEVESRVNRLIEQLQSKGAPPYIATSNRVETVLIELNMLRLRRLVIESDELNKPDIEEYDVLSYYANSIVHRLPNGQRPL